LFPEIANIGVKLLCDDDPKELNQTSLEAFLSHFPAGTSFKSVRHYKQLMNSKQFEHFDFGLEENQKRYGQDQPPPIPLANIQGFPIAMLAGSEDKLAHIDDVRWLKELMVSQDSLLFYEEYRFGHLAFLIPNNLKVYQDIVNLLKTFNPAYVRKREVSTSNTPIKLSDQQMAETFTSSVSE